MSSDLGCSSREPTACSRVVPFQRLGFLSERAWPLCLPLLRGVPTQGRTRWRLLMHLCLGHQTGPSSSSVLHREHTACFCYPFSSPRKFSPLNGALTFLPFLPSPRLPHAHIHSSAAVDSRSLSPPVPPSGIVADGYPVRLHGPLCLRLPFCSDHQVRWKACT